MSTHTHPDIPEETHSVLLHLLYTEQWTCITCIYKRCTGSFINVCSMSVFVFSAAWVQDENLCNSSLQRHDDVRNIPWTQRFHWTRGSVSSCALWCQTSSSCQERAGPEHKDRRFHPSPWTWGLQLEGCQSWAVRRRGATHKVDKIFHFMSGSLRQPGYITSSDNLSLAINQKMSNSAGWSVLQCHPVVTVC